MSPEHARLYAYVHPLFWGWLWLQLQLFTSWQRESHRTLLIAVTRWGNIYTVQIGDKVTTYRKPELTKASWDDVVWQTSNPPNLVGVFQAESQTLLAANPSAPNADLLPCEAGEVDAKRTEGGAPGADTS